MTQQQQLALPKVDFKRLTTAELESIFDNAYNHDPRIQRIVKSVRQEFMTPLEQARIGFQNSVKNELQSFGEEI